ncbi:SRPBCC family protein [Cytobacillus spongiae]|uniref:SRPBCC family protein n=1 Tax=Cytobacillus spongiae TaxID=2901381 RepID=UPI001F1B2265|nr:SRPBCC family protein [Cytobacillus spongiae]UII55825.1 SRPBCC family protein [Cytobacillus spongiae]
MADFQSSVIIHKPIHEVFDYMTNLQNMPEIMPNVVHAELTTGGTIEKGSTYVETRRVRGREVNAEVEFIEFEKEKTYTTKSITNGLVVLYRYDFDAIEEGTQVQFQATVETKGFMMKLTKRFLVNILKSEDGNQLRYVKDDLEKK